MIVKFLLWMIDQDLARRIRAYYDFIKTLAHSGSGELMGAVLLNRQTISPGRQEIH